MAKSKATTSGTSELIHFVVKLTSRSGLLQHNPQLADPECDVTKQIKIITDKGKLQTDDDRHQVARLEWYGGIYLSNGGAPPTIVEPTANIRKCFVDMAKIEKKGRGIERAVSFATYDVPLVYDGPKEIDALFADERFRDRRSVGIGRHRVMRTRPKFYPWALEAEGFFVPDIGLNFSDFVRLVALAGVAEGLGDGRRIGFGRFSAQVETL